MDTTRVVDEENPLRPDLEASFFDLPLELQKEYLPLLEAWFVEEHTEAVSRLKTTSSHPDSDRSTS